MPESPKFLMSSGRNDEALKVFQKIYTINNGKPADTYPVSIILILKTTLICLTVEFQGTLVVERKNDANLCISPIYPFLQRCNIIMIQFQIKVLIDETILNNTDTNSARRKGTKALVEGMYKIKPLFCQPFVIKLVHVCLNSFVLLMRYGINA